MARIVRAEVMRIKNEEFDVSLTSFSILFARYKGDLECTVRGAAALDTLRDGDRVLIAEGCTHHRQCEDIGTVKLPRWIRKHTGKAIEFAFSSGTEFPSDLSSYGSWPRASAQRRPWWWPRRETWDWLRRSSLRTS